MRDDREYFSVSLGLTGPNPEEGSIISIGSCLLNNDSEHFYAELKPLNRERGLGNFIKSYGGLDALKKYNSKKTILNPDEAISILKKNAQSPGDVIYDFREWVNQNSLGKDAIIVELKKEKFNFLEYYFSEFGLDNPFADSQYLLRANNKKLFTREYLEGLNRNSLEKAIAKANEFLKNAEPISNRIFS